MNAFTQQKDGVTAAVDEDDYNLLTGDFIQIKTDSVSTAPVMKASNMTHLLSLENP